MCDYMQIKCNEFIELLASKKPTPGGGGAAAFVGAIGMALGNMVGSLTVGKKKYALVEKDIIKLKGKADIIQNNLSLLVEADATAFEPLANAYGLPINTEKEIKEKAVIMENALHDACDVPLRIMKECCEAITILTEFAEKGSKIAISDAGCGAIICKAALQAASLNVFINTKLMRNREYAININAQAETMLDKYLAMADGIYDRVIEQLKV